MSAQNSWFGAVALMVLALAVSVVMPTPVWAQTPEIRTDSEAGAEGASCTRSAPVTC